MTDFSELIREIRKATGLNQTDFAREIGRVMQSVQGYESGRKPPAEVLGKLKEIAIAHDRLDLAEALGGEWKVRRVFEPGETMISSPQPRAPGKPAEKEDWHRMLDEVLKSGQADALAAVKSTLVALADLVRVRRGQVSSKPNKK